MQPIRKAIKEDIERIAEIVVFNYRLNFYPIFREDKFYFEELKVSTQAARYTDNLENIWVYDDGVVKGFIQVEQQEVKKLFVEPVLQGNSIGSELLEYAIAEKAVNFLYFCNEGVEFDEIYKRKEA